MDGSAGELLRAIPSVGELLASESGRSLAEEFGAGMTKFELRGMLDELRGQIRAGKIQQIDPEHLTRNLRQRLIRLTRPIGRQAINATGIMLHTGLGRAPLCREAIEAMATGVGYSVLQASLDTGDRSLREEKIQRMLIELTGCEAATVVNNNAAATMLVLNTLAVGKEVIISRGQLIEIGGSFRMPDVMAQSGAILREVGTTNRTHLRDYESAINEQTGAIIHVHTSNYRVRGFAGTPDIRELCELGRKRNVPVIDDLGSGAIVPLHEFGISDEPLVKESIAAGVELACFSGDKLICGPQAGIICGRSASVQKIRKNPFARMFRVCKLTLAGLEATLPHFINETYRQAIPFYRMLSRTAEELAADAEQVAGALRELGDLSVTVDDDVAYVGSGSIPDEGVPSKVVRLTHRRMAADELGRRLRQGIPSIFARLQDRMLVLDMRTLLPRETGIVVEGIRKAMVE
ncbi:MAG: L-seryl-tRNA(Sec) selenium transferase [Bacillota bacterium]